MAIHPASTSLGQLIFNTCKSNWRSRLSQMALSSSARRSMQTTLESSPQTTLATSNLTPKTIPTDSTSLSSQTTHYRITLHRSPIGLPPEIRKTLESLGIHRRMQTVFHPHSSPCAGKILAVKELVRVRNVTADEVRTKEQLRKERKAKRGYVVVRKAGAESF